MMAARHSDASIDGRERKSFTDRSAEVNDQQAGDRTYSCTSGVAARLQYDDELQIS